MMYRFDHISTLSPKLNEVLNELPEAKEGDSRSYEFSTPIHFIQGEVIANSVGIGQNVFVDFGLYDLRDLNEQAKDPAWYEARKSDPETDLHGLCWLEYLTDEQETYLKSLPSGKEGKVSDYCTHN